MAKTGLLNGGGLSWQHLAGPLALCIAAVPAFWLGLASLGEAWARPEYSHGPLIPLISGYLFLRQMRDEPAHLTALASAPKLLWPGYCFIALGLLLALVGSLSKIPDIVTYGLIIWIFGVTVTCFGWHRGWHYWPPVLHLAFMLPLPNMLYWQMSIQLQFISSELGVMLVRLMDIPVYLDGNIIDLGVYKLHVAEACSGLRYLFPVMSFSYIFAVLYRGPVWQKAVMLLAAAPITILMNSFRIGVIGILVDRYGIEHAEGFLHFFEGWIIFFACIGLLFLMAIVMKWVTRDRRPFAETLDLDYGGIGPMGLRVLSGAWTRALSLVAIGTVVMGGLLNTSLSREEVIPSRLSLSIFPASLAGWHGDFRSLDPAIAQVLKADDYLLSVYENPEHDMPVELFIAYYDKMTEGSGVHSPEVCLPAGGWEMSNIDQIMIEMDSPDGPMPTEVNRAIIQRGVYRQMVYYWFDQRGRRLTSDYEAKAYAMLDAATLGRTDGGLVRVITPIKVTETDADAEARLQEFLTASVPFLSDHIPN